MSYKADRWEISLVGNNIAGTSQYKRIRVSSTVQACSLTHLRPREVLSGWSRLAEREKGLADARKSDLWSYRVNDL